VELAGREVLVLGFGVSGRSAMDHCVRRGARVVVADERPRTSIPEAADLPTGVEGRFGVPFPDLARFDLVIPSPGIPAARYAGRAKRAWGDIELCARSLACPIVAVTGTNGKSTVVRLIEALATAAGLRARAAGNIGVPALSLLDEPLDLAVLEVSSFQLESVESFRPRAALLLNLTPDHFDRHGDLAGYLAAKSRIFARQGPGDVAIVNGDDPVACGAPVPAGVRRLAFFRAAPEERSAGTRGGVDADGRAWIDGDRIALEVGGRRESVSLAGAPSLAQQKENVAAALLALAALAEPLGIDLARAATALPGFAGLPHRCVRVAEIGGVAWYDDSKATNLGAAARALETMAAPVVWIAGGRHKGADLAPLAASARGRVRVALLIGEAAPLFERALAGQVPTERVGELDKAVARAAALAQPGDAVLLAPACSSFDQFQSFEDRGRQFVAAVQRLESTGSPS